MVYGQQADLVFALFQLLKQRGGKDVPGFTVNVVQEMER